ncbi:flagellar hook protein [Luteibacter pinisoli]|uniref:Flagellar hook-associated protein 2 n=1 Tax=Luteibacter pinisoli TaxID=2589080 RepID=A0A4Y5Z3H2_9GAMM|nr:flagellar filament capping protein FliD [Luteibacter pinisoli]QDE39831.1 flagellar hook protein [Luteibacter pinisoli]
MTTTPSLGSSSLDVNAIVTSLVANKRAAKDKQIASAQDKATTQLSAIGNFKSALASLKAAMDTLATGKAFHALKTAVGDPAVLAASTDEHAQANAYKVVVSALATSQKTSSPAFASSTAALGGGSLTLSLGEGKMTIDLDAADSLQTVRDRINKASDNPGVTAAIITGSDGAHLVLTSARTGAANAFSVSSSGGAELAKLEFDATTGTPTVAAGDAKFTIDGTAATSASNTVADAVDGLTLTLAKTGETTVNITTDTSAAVTAVQGLATAYNAFMTTYHQLTLYDKTNKQVGALIGDATVNSIKNQVTSVLGGVSGGPGGGPHSMSDLGVAFQVDGTVKFDMAKLQKVLATSPKETEALFVGEKGIAARLTNAINGWTGTTGILSQRADNLNKRLDDLDEQHTALDEKMTAYTKQLTKRYTDLDNLMAKLGNTSSYLSQQFEALTKKD